MLRYAGAGGIDGLADAIDESDDGAADDPRVGTMLPQGRNYQKQASWVNVPWFAIMLMELAFKHPG